MGRVKVKRRTLNTPSQALHSKLPPCQPNYLAANILGEVQPWALEERESTANLSEPETETGTNSEAAA